MLSALHAAMAEVVLAKSSEESTEKSWEKIISLLRREPTLSARALAERLDITARAVEKQIARLRKDGRLVRVGPAKGGKWSVV